MIEYLKGLWARVTVHWSVVAAAFIAALPSILDYLGLIDLKPLLLQVGVGEGAADLIVKLLPFVLAFIKPMIAVEAPASQSEPKADE